VTEHGCHPGGSGIKYGGNLTPDDESYDECEDWADAMADIIVLMTVGGAM